MGRETVPRGKVQWMTDPTTQRKKEEPLFNKPSGDPVLGICFFFYISPSIPWESINEPVHWPNDRDVTDLGGSPLISWAKELRRCFLAAHLKSFLFFHYHENNGNMEAECLNMNLNNKQVGGTGGEIVSIEHLNHFDPEGNVKRKRNWIFNCCFKVWNVCTCAHCHVGICSLFFFFFFTFFTNQKHYLLCLWPHKTQPKKETYKPCMNTKQVVEIHRCYFINTATLLKHAAIKGCSIDKNVGEKKAISESKI